MNNNVNKIVDICLSQSDRAANTESLTQIKQEIAGLKTKQKELERVNKRLINSERERKFELMLSMSHRRFCSLMKIKGRL